VEVSQVRRRIQAALSAARDRSQRRRQIVADAERSYDGFLADVAIPLARQAVNVLNAEGRTFTVSTPGRGVRLSPDRGVDDYIELTLNTDLDPPTVVGHIRYTRGSRTIDEERPIKAATAPDAISEDDVLEFLMWAIEPWIER
jgi:hypothetical protein